MKVIGMLPTVLLMSISGCGTVSTAFNTDEQIVEKFSGWNSRCEHISRVYSGVAFDFCYLNAEPVRGGRIIATPSVPLLTLDMCLSALVDTVLLPYTIYRQSSDGDISLVRK